MAEEWAQCASNENMYITHKQTVISPTTQNKPQAYKQALEMNQQENMK